MLVNNKDLLDESQCYDKVRELRWPEGRECPFCKSRRVIRRGFDDTESPRQRYQCKECSKRFDNLTGRTQLNRNLYFSCNTRHRLGDTLACPARIGYQFCKMSKDGKTCLPFKEKGQVGIRAFSLPKGNSIVWQNPSPHDSPYSSILEGSDLNQKSNGNSILFRPSLCQTLSTQLTQ